MKKQGIAVILSLATGMAAAQAYVGGAFGRTSFKIDCAGTDSCDDSDSGYKVHAGLKLNPALALELGYIDFGKARATTTVNGFNVRLSRASNAVTLAAAGRLALSANVEVVGRLGLAHVRTRISGSVPAFGASSADSESSVQPYAGVALQYAFHKQMRGALAFDTTHSEKDGDKATVRLFSAGFEFAF